jgi:hypothetical protein
MLQFRTSSRLRAALPIVASSALAIGCASGPPPKVEWEIHHYGRIETKTAVTFEAVPAERRYLMFAGPIPIVGLASPSQIKGFRYRVRTPNSELVDIEEPSSLEIGACVEILGTRSDVGGLSYPFPLGRLAASSRCAP